MLTVCCLNAHNYMARGREYVEKLHSAVSRNLTLPHRFVCFTDDPESYHYRVQKRPLPHDGLTGWCNKLALFKPGVLEAERVVYIDLDTVITGPLDDLFAYSGNFAMLAPFYTNVLPPFDGYQSGLMAWRAGTQTHIWEAYKAAGCPEVRGGDQAFINSLGVEPDTWQAMFPRRVVSYKAEGGKLPEGTSAVCFHGVPRPHQITSGWVPEHWR